MAYIHPAAIEHHRKRWERADAYRFAAPGAPEAKGPSTLHPWAEVARQEQMAADEARARAAAEPDEFEREVLALRHDFAKLKLEYELRRFHQKYSPDQPRVPAGNPDGGQWTSDGGSGAGRAQSADVGPRRIRLAGDITGFTKHGMYRAMQRGISPSAMQDAVVSPLQIIPQANGNTQYVGRDAVVVLNPLGQVVTVWSSR